MDYLVCNPGEDLLGRPTTWCTYGSCSDHVPPRRGGNAGEEGSQCEPWRRAPSLARSHAKVQAPISGATSCVNGEAHIDLAHQEREYAMVTDAC